MTFYFAWVDPAATDYAGFGVEHYREDLQIFAFSLDHTEGDAATLSLTVAGTTEGLLAPGRDRWAWFAWDNGASVTPLFFGSVIGSPEQVSGRLARIVLVARPSDLEARKETLAAGLRAQPYFDPVWIPADARGTPDAVLEGRSAVWHVDRVSHDLTISDVLEGEAGTETVTALSGDFSMRIVAPPVSKCRITAQATWTQSATGLLDVAPAIKAAFAAAGAPHGGFIATYTGEGLANDWPFEGARIGGGWEVGPTRIARYTGFAQSFAKVRAASGGQVGFPLWELDVEMSVRYDVGRPRSETVTLEVDAGLQAVAMDETGGVVEEISLSSSAPGEFIDGAFPIGNLARRSYFQTERGRASIEALIARARALIRARARVVEVTARIPFDEAVGLTLRQNATIAAPQLPGGTATGKLVSLSLALDEGALYASVRIGCAVGDGVGYTPAAPAAGYAVEGYVAEGYQAATTGGVALASGDVALPAFGAVEIDDDGADLLAPTAEDMVLAVTVTNGPTVQAALASADPPPEDMAAALQAMKELATTVRLQMRPLDGLAFSQTYDLGATTLALPATIDLSAMGE